MCPNPNKLIDLKTHNPKLNTTHVYCIYLPSFTFGFPWSHGVSRNTYICENHHSRNSGAKCGWAFGWFWIGEGNGRHAIRNEILRKP